MLNLSDNPPSVFPAEADWAALTCPWRVAHTKARTEKSFAWDLSRHNVPYFLPLIERIRISGGRKRKGLLPLFTGYVFFNGNDQARYAALATNHLCQVIDVKDQHKLLHELSDIRRVIESGVKLDPYPLATLGSRCRVTAGPLQGIEGTLIRRDGALKFVLQVSILGQGAELEIEPDLLEITEDAASASR